MVSNAQKNDDIHVKTNHELKLKAIKVLEKNGLDLDTALNLTLEKIVDEDRLPFEREETYEEQLQRFEEDIEMGKQAVKEGRYITLEDFKNKYDFLNKDS